MAVTAGDQLRKFAQPVDVTGYEVSNLTSNALTNAIKSGPGVLHSVTINKKGASSNLLVLYDSLTASGTPFATIDTTLGQATLIYDAAFNTGLSTNMITGTAADVTLTYR